jgi:uncharacterized membrane protein
MEDFAMTAQYLVRWLHVFSGILWIGLLYYFNFVQIPTMPKIPAELKPAVSKHIAPNALFFFRWAAVATVVFGVILAMQNHYFGAAMSLAIGQQDVLTTMIGIGMWLGIIMAINVWVFIWPNQKIALGIVDADADAKAKAGRTAMLFSRTNFILSLPMLYCMVVFRGLGA